MKLYFFYSQVPEIAALPREERSNAYNRYIRPLLVRWPARLLKFAFYLVCYSAMVVFELYDSFGKAAVWFVGCFVADHFFDISVIALHRPQLRAAIHASLPNEGA